MLVLVFKIEHVQTQYVQVKMFAHLCPSAAADAKE